MYQDRLSSGVDLGYHDKVKHFDPAHAAKLKENVARFSAYKEAAFKRDISALLGKTREEFIAEAQKISNLYHKAWMDTEYHHAVAAAIMSAKWAKFQERKDLYPNLRYVAVIDGRTRAQHAQWHNTVRSIDDSWWDTHLPPNDWGCRCNVVQTDKDVTEAPADEAKETFANNPGKSGKVFVNSGYEKSLSANERKEAEELADRQIKKEVNKQTYHTLKKDPDYTDVVLDALSGGVKATHKKHQFDSKTGRFEKAARDVLYKKGHNIQLTEEWSLELNKRFAEGMLDGNIYEQATVIGTGKNAVKRALNHCRQKEAQTAVIYFTDKANYLEKWEKGLNLYEKYTTYRFEKIILIIGEEVIYFK